MQCLWYAPFSRYDVISSLPWSLQPENHVRDELCWPINPTALQDNTIDKGDFTVEMDRKVVKKLGEVAVKKKIEHLSTAGPLHLYRFFLAWRSKMLGQPSVTWEIDAFLSHYKFPDLESAIRDKSSMSAVVCATFSGDVDMVRFLAQQKADLNVNFQHLEELGYAQDWNLLMAALESRQSPEMIFDRTKRAWTCMHFRFSSSIINFFQ